MDGIEEWEVLQKVRQSTPASYALAPFRQDRAWLCRTEDSHGQSKEIQEWDHLRLQHHNICTVYYFILHHWAHLSGTQRPCTRLPWDIKGRRSLHTLDSRRPRGGQSQHKLGFTPNNPALNLLRAQAIQHTVDVGYYAPAARTTLNLLCSSRSSTEIGLTLAKTRVLTLWICSPRHLCLMDTRMQTLSL